jgi:hypothetical protein
MLDLMTASRASRESRVRLCTYYLRTASEKAQYIEDEAARGIEDASQHDFPLSGRGQLQSSSVRHS